MWRTVWIGVVVSSLAWGAELSRKDAKAVERIDEAIYRWPAEAQSFTARVEIPLLTPVVESLPTLGLSEGDEAAMLAFLTGERSIQWDLQSGLVVVNQPDVPVLDDTVRAQGAAQMHKGLSQAMVGMGQTLQILRKGPVSSTITRVDKSREGYTVTGPAYALQTEKSGLMHTLTSQVGAQEVDLGWSWSDLKGGRHLPTKIDVRANGAKGSSIEFTWVEVQGTWLPRTIVSGAASFVLTDHVVKGM